MLNISLLGRLQVEYAHIPLRMPASIKSTVLFAYLLLHSGPVSRPTLCRLLWPDEDEAVARARLRRHLYLLRQFLPTPAANSPWLLVTADSIQWNPKNDYLLDTAAFVQASADPTRLAEAVALYEGDLLPELDEDWLTSTRAYLRGIYIAALQQLVQQQRQQRNYLAALMYAQRLHQAEPLDENAVRLLMVLRYEIGEPAAAISEYEQFARYLAVELGVAPMPETTALYNAIMTKAYFPAIAALPPEGPTPEQRGARHILPFVGREAQLEQLSACWAQATVGHGGIVLIGGEAGIGKTRLLTELSSQVALEGGRVLYGDTAFPERSPYQALVTALKGATPLLAENALDNTSLAALLPLLPELAQLYPQLQPLPHIGPERDRDRIYMAIRDCIAALVQPRPLLLILEDLHWAGSATISLLKYLIPYFTTMPILLLITYREEAVARTHPLRTLRQMVVTQSGGQQIILSRLPQEATTRAASHIATLRADAKQLAQLYRDSEGNPLFLNELVNNLLDTQDGPATPPSTVGSGLPRAIHHVVAERIGRLSANTRLLAEIASVFGVAFSVELIREVSGLEELQVLAAIDELLDHALIREAGGQLNYDYTFTHHLIQESIYQGIEAGVRRRRHRRLALVLEDLYAPQLDILAADLARHFEQGGEAGRAVPYYLNAAQAAAALFADDEAQGLLSRVLAISNDPQLRWQALALAERISQRQGDRDAQRASLAQMELLAEEQADEAWACEVLRRRIMLSSTLGERDEQARLIHLLRNRAEASGQNYWRAVTMEEEANLYLQLSQYPQTRERLNAAIQLYQAEGDSAAQVACYCLLVECVVHLGLFSEAQAILAVATKLSTAADRALLVKVLTTACKAAVMQNNFLEARSLGQQLLELCRSIQDKEGEAAALSTIATSIASTTWADEALDYFDQARRLCAQLSKRSGEVGALSNAGIFAFHVGRYNEGQAMLRQAEKMYQELANTRGQVVCLLNLAVSFIWQSDYSTAISTALHGLELIRTMNSPYLESMLMLALGHAKLELGEYEEAVIHLEAALIKQREVELYRELPITLSHLAAAYLHTGNSALAQRYVAEAIEVYETHAQNPALAPDYPQYIYWVAARLAHQQGNDELANQYLSHAAELLQQSLAAFASTAAREAYQAIHLNQSLLLMLTNGEWPSDGPSKLSLPACPHCNQNSDVIRAGLNPSGSQRYRCHHCKLYFTAQRKAHGYDQSLRSHARELAGQGFSSREVARKLGVSHRSVMNWVHTPTSPTEG